MTNLNGQPTNAMSNATIPQLSEQEKFDKVLNLYQMGTKRVHAFESALGKWHQKWSDWQEALMNQELTLLRNDRHPDLVHEYLEAERGMYARIFHARSYWDLEVSMIQNSYEKNRIQLEEQLLNSKSTKRIDMMNVVLDRMERLRHEYQLERNTPPPDIPLKSFDSIDTSLGWQVEADLNAMVLKTDNLVEDEQRRFRTILHLENMERVRHGELPLLYVDGKLLEQETVDNQVVVHPVKPKVPTPPPIREPVPRRTRNAGKSIVDLENSEESYDETEELTQQEDVQSDGSEYIRKPAPKRRRVEPQDVAQPTIVHVAPPVQLFSKAVIQEVKTFLDNGVHFKPTEERNIKATVKKLAVEQGYDSESPEELEDSDEVDEGDSGSDAGW